MKLRNMTTSFMFGALFFGSTVFGDPVPVANYSFEDPVTEYVTPVVSDWDEIDPDPYSQNTGAFLNVPGDPASYIVNADGTQVGFLIAGQEFAFQQQLLNVYQVGKSYQLTAAVGISYYAPPEDPDDPLELAFYYINENQEVVDIAIYLVPFAGRIPTSLDDFSVNLPEVQSANGWSGKNIGIAIRGTSDVNGTWIIDNIRVDEYPSTPNFTDDSIINFADFAQMAAEWQLCGDLITDVTGEGCVNEADLLILIERWLDNV